jgi:hypothetical protein
MWGGFEELTKIVSEVSTALDDVTKGKTVDDLLDFDKLQNDLDPKLVAEEKRKAAEKAAKGAEEVVTRKPEAAAAAVKPARTTPPAAPSPPSPSSPAPSSNGWSSDEVAALRRELEETKMVAAAEGSQRQALQEMVRVQTAAEVTNNCVLVGVRRCAC